MSSCSGRCQSCSSHASRRHHHGPPPQAETETRSGIGVRERFPNSGLRRVSVSVAHSLGEAHHSSQILSWTSRSSFATCPRASAISGGAAFPFRVYIRAVREGEINRFQRELRTHPGRHLGICVEPDCQRFEGLSVYAALVDPLEQMLKKRSRDVFALNLWHQEPA